MVEIKRTSKELDKVTIYRMTLDNAITSCKDLDDGTEITVSAWLEYDDTKENGKVETVFSILASDGHVYACTSKTFARNIMEIADVFDGEEFTIVKNSGVSKAGKNFIYASLKY